STLLGAVDRGGTGLPQEGVVDVCGEHEICLPHRRVKRVEIDTPELRERYPPAREPVARCIVEVRAEAFHHSRAAVGRGAAAHAEDDPASTGVQGVGDELPRPAGGGVPCIEV